MPSGTRASGINRAPSRSIDPSPQIIGHRGASGVCPENTMAAFAKALRLGADGIELDLQLTRDGVPVVYHDRTLAKIGASGTIRAHTLAQLRRLDFGGWFAKRFARERIPTLDDVLDRFCGRTELLLELKPDDEPPARVLALVREVERALGGFGARARSRVKILCFDPRVLRSMARVAPRLARVRNIDVRPEGAALVRALGQVGTLCLPARLVDPALAEAVHARGRELFVYRCDTARNLARALRCNVDGIITDRPDWLRAELARSPGRRARG